MTEWFSGPLGGLSDQDWDRLAGDRFYSSSLWLRLCALSPGSTSGGLHVDLPGGGRAAVPVARVRDEPNPHCRWHDQLTKRGLPAPPPQGILVGQRRGYQAHLLASPAVDPAVAAGALLDALRSVREPSVAMYVTTPDVRSLRAAGVRALPVALTTDAWIDVPPGGWEAWTTSLGTRNRSRRVRREARNFARAGYRLEHRTLKEAYHDVARLLARTEARYGRTVDVEPLARSFRAQGELAGDRAEVTLCSLDDGPPLGFCLYYRQGDTVFLRAVGFDYEKLSGAAEYFNLTYYIPARLPGVRRLHAGIETPDAKARRGATLEPLWLLDLSEDSVLNGHDSEVRRHNHAFLTLLRDTSPMVAEALVDELWEEFT
ncbi:hypothetical protein [Kibdelosporangium phytohabitans]|uniref:BioF2-like acetyltransferase domain-containing protein n=1 Tax=Kibdelosporangium phytohabitans TaxID=860235 RepID=A0A0N9HR61_9PSEU|nr:hypothetical protein [Kibdelosporangium phytohabitans]ALG09674.1 hypothetical protein AOZ06_24680 [Kibdelosporangium phytohabitans]MBE1468979.1 hypothetical protein [Kibdelosporangium phytohabitans]